MIATRTGATDGPAEVTGTPAVPPPPPSNAPPTAADGTVTATEDQDDTFPVADFHDAARDGDARASVTIVTLPASGRGTLTRGEGTVTAGDSVTRTPLAAGTVTYSPPAGAPGAGSASFTFTVNDGPDDSASASTLTIDIAPAAPEPVPALPRLGQLLLALGLLRLGVMRLSRRGRHLMRGRRAAAGRGGGRNARDAAVREPAIGAAASDLTG